MRFRGCLQADQQEVVWPATRFDRFSTGFGAKKWQPNSRPHQYTSFPFVCLDLTEEEPSSKESQKSRNNSVTFTRTRHTFAAFAKCQRGAVETSASQVQVRFRPKPMKTQEARFITAQEIATRLSQISHKRAARAAYLWR